MSQELTFYDIPCVNRGSWSPNTEKTRLSLNFKGLKYTTVQVEYPDIKPLLSSLGVAPNSTGTPYTLPALRVGGEVPFMESLDHVRYLDKAYPDLPTLIPTESIETLTRFHSLLAKIGGPLFRLLLSSIPTHVLSSESAGYFRETREDMFKSSLETVSGVEGSEHREQLWAELEEGLKPVAAMLGEKEGPFFEGNTATFVDLEFVGYLFWARRSQEATFQRIMKVDPKFQALWDATAEWRNGTGL